MKWKKVNEEEGNWTKKKEMDDEKESEWKKEL